MPVPFYDAEERITNIIEYCKQWEREFEGKQEIVRDMLQAFREAVELLQQYILMSPQVQTQSKRNPNHPLEQYPKYEIVQFVEVIEEEWDLISRLCIQRLTHLSQRMYMQSETDANEDSVFLPTASGDLTKLLRTADIQALTFYNVFEGFRTAAVPLVLFDKAYHITHYTLTPYPIIAIPFSFYERKMQPQALAHEIGHYIFSHSNDPTSDITAEQVLRDAISKALADLTYVQDTKQTRDKYSYEDERLSLNTKPDRDEIEIINDLCSDWLEEIFADVFGVLLAGPSFVDSAINLMFVRCLNDTDEKKIDSHLARLHDGAHPAPYLRPIASLTTLRWLSERAKSEYNISQSLQNKMHSFYTNRMAAWVESIYLNMTMQKASKTIRFGEALIPQNIVLPLMIALEKVVETILEGFTDAPSWQAPNRDDEIFGVGHLISIEALMRIFETVEHLPELSDNPLESESWELAKKAALIPNHRKPHLKSSISSIIAATEFNLQEENQTSDHKTKILTVLDNIRSKRAFWQKAKLGFGTINFRPKEANDLAPFYILSPNTDGTWKATEDNTNGTWVKA